MPGSFAYYPSTRTIVVTGGSEATPADFPSLWAADRANPATLLDASAPAANKTLARRIRPVELLALQISFIVAGKTAETDYLFVTGTDAWDNAQTESINVSAGNGTYVSAKRFRTITNIDCSDNPNGGGTVWANGTIRVDQPIWGHVWKLGTNADRVWKHDCKVQIGDDATSTYFALENGVIYSDFEWATDYGMAPFHVTPLATLRLGQLEEENGRFVTGGVAWFASTTSPYYVVTHIFGVFLGYGLYMGSTGANMDFFLNFAYSQPGSRLWHCTFDGPAHCSGFNNVHLYNVRIIKIWAGLRGPGLGSTYENIEAVGTGYACYFTSNSPSVEIRNLKARTCGSHILTWANSNVNHSIINPDFGIPIDNPLNNSFSGGTVNTAVWMKYTVSLLIVDLNGNPVQGATVRLTNKNGLYSNDWTRYGINDYVTGADGRVVDYEVSRGYYHSDAGNTFVDFSPHVLRVSKPGYLTTEIYLTLDKIDWKVLLMPASVGLLVEGLTLNLDIDPIDVAVQVEGIIDVAVEVL